MFSCLSLSLVLRRRKTIHLCATLCDLLILTIDVMSSPIGLRLRKCFIVYKRPAASLGRISKQWALQYTPRNIFAGHLCGTIVLVIE